ncbi:MAG: cysteine desulfurase [Alphaproteobacteria bacterium]|nr:cysteine desulfurase [Alphaproteobacteria bacterium]MDA7989660.1 cysteine desulfurase [Gammaproteobacteria bacterium]
MMKIPVYLDHHSTTPLDKRVLDEMMPYMTEKFGNPSSLDHGYGSEASSAVEMAREKISKSIGARREEIIFTSGATESDNLALLGTMNKYADRGNHLVTCTTEHKAVLDVTRHLETIGKQVTYVPVNEVGDIDMGTLEGAITDRTVLISIMVANNEIGTIHNVAKIGKIAHERNILFHTDAAQAAGHIPIDVSAMNIDLMSFSAHKMYGPKGVGALYVRGLRPRVRPNPIIHGGGHERNMRSGTLNVSGIVGFGKATEIAQKEMHIENKRFKRWSKMIMDVFLDKGAMINGSTENRLAHNISVCFPGIEGKAIINSVSKQIAISAGSACTTQTVEPSHVILALGFGEDRAHSTIRAGLGRFNTEDEVQFFMDTVVEKIDLLSKIHSNT